MAMRLKTLINQFLEWCEKARKPSTGRNYRWLLFKFLKHTGNVPIDKLKPLDLSIYATTWHEVQSVQRLFQWAKDDLEAISRNPFSKVKRPPPGQRKRVLDPRELSRYFRRAQPAFRRFLLAMRATLARPQEIRGLIWEMLRAENPRDSIEEALAAGRAIFVMHEYKCRDVRLDPSVPRVLFVNRRLGRLLLRMLGRIAERKGPIFLNERGQPYTGNAIRCCMRRLRRRCKSVRDVGGEQICVYTIRHSMATIASAAGVRDRKLAEILGHTSTQTTARYQHLQLEHLREAMNQIDQAMKQKRKAA